MKALLLSVIIFTSVEALAQDPPPVHFPHDTTTGLISYSGIVYVDGASQDELFSRSLSWFANAFKNSQAVIQYSSKEDGKVIAKGTIDVGVIYTGVAIEGYSNFAITVEMKDGKYRYSLLPSAWENTNGKWPDYDFNNPDKEYNKWMPKKAHEIEKKTDDGILELLSSLITAMSRKEEKW